MGSGALTTDQHSPLSHGMKTALLLLAALAVTAQARRVKKLHFSEHGPAKLDNELEKEASNKIYHGPDYKKPLTDEQFERKKARYYKKLRLGHKGEHRAANTKYDLDDLSLQDLSASPAKTSQIRKPTNFTKVMKLKSLKPNKKMKKVYKKKMFSKKKQTMKKKHLKKHQKHQIP